jgi:hypothetical protein
VSPAATLARLPAVSASHKRHPHTFNLATDLAFQEDFVTTLQEATFRNYSPVSTGTVFTCSDFSVQKTLWILTTATTVPKPTRSTFAVTLTKPAGGLLLAKQGNNWGVVWSHGIADVPPLVIASEASGALCRSPLVVVGSAPVWVRRVFESEAGYILKRPKVSESQWVGAMLTAKELLRNAFGRVGVRADA